jgi:hypothetical protein
MSNTNLQFENAAQQFLNKNPELAAKYFSLTLLKTLVAEMQSSLPTLVAARLAFDRLVANGTLQRTDGKSDQDDAQANVSRAQKHLDETIAKVDAAPLTPGELEYFGSLGQRELSKLYYGPDGDAVCDFAVRYRKASREFGYRIPGRFGDQAVAVADAGDIQLTASEYHAIPSDVLKVRMRDPRWKAAIYRLIKAGQI